ncbi:MAG: NAD-dependent epimerase/dehydratase family protein [Caldilineaceae bacterium]
MSKEVLITGGAGFVGAHLANGLINHGYHVCVMDKLLPQVHGSSGKWPAYLHPAVEMIRGDICDPSDVRRACRNVDIVYHLAARVGVGQSMYEISRYTETNNGGTAVLLEELIQRPVGCLVVASSMSIYGEGSIDAAPVR